jgi:HK97 family phage portal protein
MSTFTAAVARPFAMASQSLAALGTATMRFVGGAQYSVGILLGRTKINYLTETGDPTKNPIVVSVVGWIARNFSEAPLRVLRLAEDGSVETIPPGKTGPGFMLRLLENPNEYFSGIVQMKATVIDLKTRGDAYWIKVRNGPGPDARVVELWWVPWWMMQPYWEPGSGRFIDYYIYTVDGVQYRIPTYNVVHFREGIDPLNVRCGLSPLASLYREIFTDDEAANFTAVLLKNFAVPGVILAPSNTGGAFGKADPEAVKKKYIETFGGDERGNVMAMATPTDIKVLSWSPEQLNLRELRRIPEERVSAVLGVPASVANLGAGLDQNAFTSYTEARRAAYQEVIVPDHGYFASELEVQLLPDFADTEAETFDMIFDESKASALQEALEAVWKRNESAATKGLLKRSEFRQAVGHTVEDGDDVYILPQNYVVVGPGGAASAATPGPSTPARFGGATHSPLLCSNEECGKILAETATAPYRFTCRHCKAVTEETVAPSLSIVGERYEYDDAGRVAGIYEVVA